MNSAWTVSKAQCLVRTKVFHVNRAASSLGGWPCQMGFGEFFNSQVVRIGRVWEPPTKPMSKRHMRPRKLVLPEHESSQQQAH